jgi:hypothetical protein
VAQRKDDSFTDILGVDLERPNAARVYDYWLGGSSNFDVDRELGDEMVRIDPGVLDMARANRTFLYQVVTWLAHHGITQFLDLGSGIPTVGNVHEVAQAIEPSARVSYVDNEPVAVAHSKALLRDNSLATVTNADLRNVDAVLHAPTVAGLLDFDRPIAVLMLSVPPVLPGRGTPGGGRGALRRGADAGFVPGDLAHHGRRQPPRRRRLGRGHAQCEHQRASTKSR